MSDQSNDDSDLVVRAEIIKKFQEIDLATIRDFPTGREELIALSTRMNALFSSVWMSSVALIPEEYDTVPVDVMDEVFKELALNFIERYGMLALLSTGVLNVLWRAQRLSSPHGPECLREVGQKLSIFVLASRGGKPSKTIDVAFKLFKSGFVAELERLSRALGESQSEQPWNVQLLGLVKVGEYPRLKLNLSILEQFLTSKSSNQERDGKLVTAADQLAEYGIGRLLRERRKGAMTPDCFFYTWIGWITNKSPGTVRREIQTAQSQFIKKVVTKNR
jgi:hypothetical protein